MLFTQGNVIAVIFIVIVLSVATGFTFLTNEKKEQTKLTNSPAGQSFADKKEVKPYTNINGDAVVLSDYLGHVLVVLSWASWCPSCGTELNKLSEFSGSSSSDDLRILAINRAEPATTAERYLHSIGGTDGVTLILDPEDRYYQSIDGYAMPEMVIYDKKGEVVYHHRGQLPVSELQAYVEVALQNTEN